MGHNRCPSRCLAFSNRMNNRRTTITIGDHHSMVMTSLKSQTKPSVLYLGYPKPKNTDLCWNHPPVHLDSSSYQYTNQHRLTSCGVGAAGAAALFYLGLAFGTWAATCTSGRVGPRVGTPNVHPKPIVNHGLSSCFRCQIAFLGFVQLLEPNVFWIKH